MDHMMTDERPACPSCRMEMLEVVGGWYCAACEVTERHAVMPRHDA